jgi:Tol biopolymer transport system component
MAGLRFAGLLTVAVLTAGCTNVVAGTPKATLDVGTVKVTSARPLTVGNVSSLSPDGRRVLIAGAGGFCVQDRDGAHKVCADPKKVRPDTINYAWSPDGSQIVTTDDFFRALREPDIWVMNTKTGAVRDITNDGVTSWNFNNPPSQADIDLWPAWSSDGKTIRFARQNSVNANTIMLESISAKGGAVRKIGTLSARITTLNALEFSADGKRIAWSDEHGGTVHVRPTAGGVVRTVVAGGRALDNSLLSFSPDGKYLLVDSITPYGQYVSTGGKPSVVSLATSRVGPVAGDVSASYPTWAPDSDALLFIRLAAGVGQLRVVARPGGKSRELRSGGIMSVPQYRLAWNPSGAVLCYVQGEPYLLTLGA